MGKTIRWVFIFNVVVWMGLAGWISLNEGVFRFSHALMDANALTNTQRAIQQARAEPSTQSLREFSEELWAMASLTSAERFVNSRLPEQGEFYMAMPKPNQVLMAVHVVLGSFCMLLGGLQFWPWFRKRYMKAHRLVGGVYLLTVPPSIVAVLAYMALTAPHHIYDHLIAWVALWLFGVLALVSIAMAVRALRHRKLHEHQAWMALSFGCLAVAPLLRLNWVFLAWVFPHIDQETLNLVTLVLMLPQSLFLAWGLLAVNRQFERPMRQRPVAAPAQKGAALFARVQWGLIGLGLGMLVVNCAVLYTVGGWAGLSVASGLIPQALLDAEMTAVRAAPLASWVVAVGMAVAFIAGVALLGQLLKGSTTERPGNIGCAAATVGPAGLAGLCMIMIGHQIGLVSGRVMLSGGTWWLVSGALVLALALRLAQHLAQGDNALAKEALVFLLCLLPAPTLLVLTLYAVHWVGLPQSYIQDGQGYMVPAGFSLGLLFMGAVHMVYGQTTREHN